MTLASPQSVNEPKAYNKARSSQLNNRKLTQTPNFRFVIIALFFYIYSPPIAGIPIGLDKLIALCLVLFWKKSLASIAKGIKHNKTFIFLLFGSIIIAAVHDAGSSKALLETRSYNLVCVLF